MTYFPTNAKLPNAVFFDWDGTIVDSYQLLSDAHDYTLTTLGMPILEKDGFREYFGKERMFILSDIYKDKKDKAIEIFQAYVSKNSHVIKPISGAKEALAFLRQKGVTLGVVTNKRRTAVEKEHVCTRLNDYLPIVVTAGEAKQDKPSAEPLLLAIEKSGLDIEKDEIWYVGDTGIDLQCARNTQCKSVFIKGHIDTKKLLTEYTPYISFDNYALFREFLVAI